MYGHGGVDFGCVAAVDVSSADWAKALWRLGTIGDADEAACNENPHDSRSDALEEILFQAFLCIRSRRNDHQPNTTINRPFPL